MSNLRWTIGDVTITRVVEMELPVPYSEKHSFLKQATPDALKEMPWLSPHFVTPEGALVLSIHALLVEAPRLKLIVDTCIGNDKPPSHPQTSAADKISRPPRRSRLSA